jgi:hypothetical protein
MTVEPRQHFTALLDSLGVRLEGQRRLLEQVGAQLAHCENLRRLMRQWLEEERP